MTTATTEDTSIRITRTKSKPRPRTKAEPEPELFIPSTVMVEKRLFTMPYIHHTNSSTGFSVIGLQ